LNKGRPKNKKKGNKKMQKITILKNIQVQIVEGVSPKNNKPYMMLKAVDNENHTLFTKFISSFYEHEFFKSIISKGGE
jgi:hypothetical protein